MHTIYVLCGNTKLADKERRASLEALRSVVSLYSISANNTYYALLT